MKPNRFLPGLAAISVFALSPAFAATEPLQVMMKNAQGEDLGFATLTETDDGVKVELDLKGLPPGKHAFHIHEKGECAAPSFESSGAHYNPTGKAHGKKAKKGKHAGDFDNIEVSKDGTLEVERRAKRVTLAAGNSSLRKAGGTALVIHEKPDDYKSQPSGNAGARIACGVIPPL